MAAERLGRVDPLVMFMDGLRAAFGIRIAQRTFAIDHDQDVLDAFAGSPPVELGQVFGVLCFVLEELVDVLARSDAVLPPGDCREVEVVDLVLEERPVQ